jgi:hypothetical protein
MLFVKRMLSINRCVCVFRDMVLARVEFFWVAARIDGARYKCPMHTALIYST